MPGQPSARPLVRFGVFELDVSAGELRKQGRKINLQQQPFQVLALLLRRPGELVTREELQQELWPADTFVEFDQGLNTAIKKIRQALDDSADHPRFVETLPRKGYRFIAAVSGGESGVESSTPPTVRGSRPLWAAAALALAVAAGVAWWLLNQRNEAKLSETAAAALVPVPLTSYPGMETWPSFSPDGNQVAFEWENPGGRPGIYVKLVGEGEPVRLTEGCCPSWSPDGRYIAFVKYEPRAGVFVIPATGGSDRKLTQLNFENFPGIAWYRGGKWLIVTGKDSPEEPQALFLLSPESGEKRRLTTPPAGSGSRDMYPALSPGGEAVVFSRRSHGQAHLFLLELSEGVQPEGEPRRITWENTYNNEPAWTPDGRAIVFTSGASHAPGLYQMELSRPGWRPGKPRRLAFAGEGVHTPAISSQARLAYAAWTVQANIWRIELNGGLRVTEPPQRLIASTRLDHVPEYSPDGKRIAFASNRSGSHEIWVCNSDGSGAMKLTSFGGSFSTADPHWSPDGRLILFNSDAEGHADTYVIDSDGGKPKLLFANSIVDSWSRDRKWVYYHRKGENQLWKRRWPPSEQDEDPVQITQKGGDFARESPDGRVVYYQKSFKEFTSLWKVPVEGGEETQVIESVYSLAFAVVDQGIYFAPSAPHDDPRTVQFLSFATGHAATISTTSGHVGYGFSVSPDGRSLIYSQYQPRPGDLWMVENFR
jgi:Tol biopolymer transport system component/DNA-binding winged helix-turn-helix (wHTH) protein